jgi:hypothetical protein
LKTRFGSSTTILRVVPAGVTRCRGLRYSGPSDKPAVKQRKGGGKEAAAHADVENAAGDGGSVGRGGARRHDRRNLIHCRRNLIYRCCRLLRQPGPRFSAPGAEGTPSGIVCAGGTCRTRLCTPTPADQPNVLCNVATETCGQLNCGFPGIVSAGKFSSTICAYCSCILSC